MGGFVDGGGEREKDLTRNVVGEDYSLASLV